MTVLSLALFVSAGLALWVGRLGQRTHATPGRTPFLWLMAAVAAWCATSGVHGLVDSLPAKLLWAKVQYVAISSVPPLWLLFAAEYADAGWTAKPGIRRALWIVPAVTVAAALTNEWHRAVWTDVSLAPGGRAVYAHGWWFWVAVTYNYALVVGGAALLLKALRLSPPPFRSQWISLITGALIPLAANATYLFGLSIPGFDATPVAFTISGLLFTRSIYADRLFDLLPVARDTVIESLSDAVIVVDGRRRVLDMNSAARQIAGNPATWTGGPLGAIVPVLRDLRLDPESDSFTTLADRSSVPEPTYYDVRMIRVRTRRYRSAAWVVVLRDITEQLQAEAERAALQARVQEQQKRESLSVLASGLAHDFNNLLAGIVGNADLLSLQVAPSSEMGNSVGAILLGAQRAADLVDKMLAYAGERHGSVETVEVHELVREMVELMRASAARHCMLEYSGEPAVIRADATQIRQVAMNLIINAADAVEERTGRIHASVGVEAVTAEQLSQVDAAADAVPGDFVYLDVADNGPGMDAATLKRIFEPFFTTKPTGHGLGLAAVQGIIHGHRGALRVKSTPGAGTQFRVWFPRSTATPAEAPRRRPTESRTSERARTR